MKFPDLELDAAAQEFFEEIAVAMKTAFSISEDEAASRVNLAFKRGRTFTVDSMIFHEAPEHWAKAVYFGKWDYWRQQ